MPVTPYIPDYDVLQIEILLNGENKGLHTVLKKADVHYELNKIPYAKLSFIASNPDLEGESNPLESDNIAVNDEIEIKVNVGEEAQTMFKGIVFKLERNVDPTSGFETKIECKDPCINLTSQLEDIADETFEDRMGRFLQAVEVTNEAELGSWGSEIVSKTSNSTPWDYLISYLDSLGQMSTIREGIFTVYDSTAESEEEVYIATNGINVFEFEGREEETVSSVRVQYWNPETQSVETEESDTDATTTEGTEVIDIAQSNFSSETLHQMMLARVAKNNLASVKGKVKTFGNLKAQYGQYLKFEKVNPVVDQIPLLISVEHHTIENACWNTEYNFGLENTNSFAENIAPTAKTNTTRLGQTNSVQGLQIGVVTQIEEDPANEFRIRVRIPSISSTGDGVWARLASLQSGNEFGGFFIPNVNDEVILGCFNNNPDTPVILGKLYSSANPPPYPIEPDNYIQGIVSKEGTRIVINDEDKSVEISTEKGNKLLISDDEKGFVMEDENQNKLMLNADGITLESAKDLILKATGDIIAEGVKSTLKATGNMELKGAMIKLN